MRLVSGAGYGLLGLVFLAIPLVGVDTHSAGVAPTIVRCPDEVSWMAAKIRLDHIAATLPSGRLTVQQRASIASLRVEEKKAFIRLAAREAKRLRDGNPDLQSTLRLDRDDAAPSTSLVDRFPRSTMAKPQRDLRFPTVNIHASGYKYFDFNYAKGTSNTGFTRSESLKLNLSANADRITVNASIDQSSQNTADQNKTQIEIIHPNAHAVLGEFKTNFIDLDIVKYNAQLDGVQADAWVANHTIGGIYSVAKGARKKEVLYGNNSQGPFVMRFVPVVPNSEQVLLNGVPQLRDRDYRVDYPSGTLRFVTHILTPEEQLTVVYESENEAYKDKVMGIKYGVLLDGKNSIGVTAIQKNEQGDQGGQSVFSTHRLGVIHSDIAVASSSIHAEYAASDMSLTGASTPTTGMAGALRVKSECSLGQWEGYWTSIGPGFQSIDSAGFTPGDVKFGGQFQARWNQWAVSSGFDSLSQTLNSIPSVEHSTRAQIDTQSHNITYKISGKSTMHSESVVTGNKVADFRRDTLDIGLDIPVIFGKLGLQSGIERRIDYWATANSFDATTVAAGYNWEMGEPMKGAIEGYRKSYAFPATANQIEDSIKASGTIHFPGQTNLDGVAQYREKTNSFPITTLSISGDTRFEKVISITSKLSVESLKETVNTSNVDVEKWDNSIRAECDPWSFLKCKATYKVSDKHPKGSTMPIFLNQEWGFDTTFTPRNTTQVVLQNHRSIQSRSQYQFFPDAVIPQSSDDQTTYIVRLSQVLGADSRLTMQAEYQDSAHMALTSTQNTSQVTTLGNSQKYKADWGSTFWGIGWGGGYEGIRDTTTAPSTNSTAQDIYSAYAQLRLAGISTVKLTFNYIYNTDQESFESLKPQVEIITQTQAISLTLRYSFLDERRSMSHPTTEIWDANLRVEFTKSLSLTASLLQENRRSPDSQNVVVVGRIGLLF